MDDLTSEQRHKNMANIRSTSNLEDVVRKKLFAYGFRYRKNDKRYPGKPDIVLPKYKTVIFINGCFWHQHQGCKYAVIPKSNKDYWIPKLQKNVERDKKNYDLLKADGWRVIVIWECELKKANKCSDTMQKLIADLKQSNEK